jgi:hypothetical protein
MARTRKPDETEKSAYERLLSQIEPGYYSGHVRLNSVQFHCPEDVIEYPMEPIEDVEISWKYSFGRTDNGFSADVTIRSRITGNSDENDSIYLELGYTLYYGSEKDLPRTLHRRFAYDKVLPQVWHYFRQHALELYFRAGLKWVIIPFEPGTIVE